MKRKILLFFFTIAIVTALLPSCAPRGERSRNYYFMDTVITVTLLDVTEEQAEPIFSHCNQLLAELDGLWARQRQISDIAKWNASPDGSVLLDARTAALLEKAIAVTQATDGAFDITVAPLVDLWQLCGERNQLPSNADMEHVLSHIGAEAVYLSNGELKKTSPDAKIDLGGIGKGAAIDYLIDYLNTCNLQGGVVSFGSNVAVFGKKHDGTPFRIGIRDPHDPNGTIGVVHLKSGDILSVSGDYERYVTIDGANYHHILDPQSGYPANTGLSSVAVIARDGAYADALSTALFVMGTESALQFYEKQIFDFEAFLIQHDGRVIPTGGMPASDYAFE